MGIRTSTYFNGALVFVVYTFYLYPVFYANEGFQAPVLRQSQDTNIFGSDYDLFISQ